MAPLAIRTRLQVRSKKPDALVTLDVDPKSSPSGSALIRVAHLFIPRPGAATGKRSDLVSVGLAPSASPFLRPDRAKIWGKGEVAYGPSRAARGLATKQVQKRAAIRCCGVRGIRGPFASCVGV
jgi:hypothetical protein